MILEKLTKEEFYSLPKNTLLLYDKDCLVLLLDNDYGEFYRRAIWFVYSVMDKPLTIHYDKYIKKVKFKNIKYTMVYFELFYGVNI
jgi:hypothetical protein